MQFEFSNKFILIVSPESWDHIFVSKHHYATHLGARGNKVYFLNPPIKENSCKPTDYENVYTINYKGFIKGLRFLPALLQRFFIRYNFEMLQKLCRVKFDIVWSFDNSVFYDFSALPDTVVKISHIVDLNQNFQTAKAAETADICFGVSIPILNRLKMYNKNTFFINHGCNTLTKQRKKTALTGNNKKKAFYAGNLNIPYIDWPLFLDLVAKNNEVDFILAGPWADGKSKEQALLFPNVYYVGQLKPDELKSYYKAADILLLVYNAEEYEAQLSNPHKMMEYLGSGKMVIATFTSEYEMFKKKGLIAMSKKNNEFPIIFNEVLSDLETWNSKEKQIARKAFALNNTYDKQISRIEEFIIYKHRFSPKK